VVSVFVEIPFGFHEFAVDPEAERARFWTTYQNRPAWFVNHHGVPVEGISVCDRPAGTEDGAIRPNIGIATNDDPTDEPPWMIVFVQIIIGTKPMMEANGKEIQVENPSFHVRTFGQAKLLSPTSFHLTSKEWVRGAGFKPAASAKSEVFQ
jgi:hypothetical protein